MHYDSEFIPANRSAFWYNRELDVSPICRPLASKAQQCRGSKVCVLLFVLYFDYSRYFTRGLAIYPIRYFDGAKYHTIPYVVIKYEIARVAFAWPDDIFQGH